MEKILDTKSLVQFLAELNNNNKKAWFDENRERYQELRGQFKELVAELLLRLGSIDEALIHTEPKQCMFRINRDIRFSRNKQPYKPHFSAAFVPFGKKTGNPGYYFRINHKGELWVGGGIFNPNSDQLWEIREDIAKNPEHVHSIIDAKNFKSNFDIYDTAKLKTAPRSYTKDHPEIELLRLKHYFGMKCFDKAAKVDLVGTALDIYKDVAPLVKWLRELTKGIKVDRR